MPTPRNIHTCQSLEEAFNMMLGPYRTPFRLCCSSLKLLLWLLLSCLCSLSACAQQHNATPSALTITTQQQQQQLLATTSKPNYLETGRKITGILDRFMSLGYDKRVRPNYGGPPVEVNVTMRILSISSVSEVMMDFTADFYFRQTWHDPRLSFRKLGDIQTLYVGAEVSKKIWLPDTFFGNEKMAYFHEATTPNVFLRIDHSGEVYRSIRLTVTSSCPMNLQYFPMDRQRCTIEAESYGYNVKDIIYRWARKDTAVERDKEISLPQFDIVQTVQKYRLEELSSGTYSRLIAEIHFARRMGYYLIQIYIPSSLIVVISWVSFWLHRNASPARVQLGVTTVLTMTTLMSSTNAALPKISYVKSIDIFLGTCFVMVFAALLEYATVGYLGKRIAMRKTHAQHAQSQAQAKLFAQLQAQGAQGDPVPFEVASTIAKATATVGSVPGQTSGNLGLFGYIDQATNSTNSGNNHLLSAQNSPFAALLSEPSLFSAASSAVSRQDQALQHQQQQQLSNFNSNNNNNNQHNHHHQHETQSVCLQVHPGRQHCSSHNGNSDCQRCSCSTHQSNQPHPYNHHSCHCYQHDHHQAREPTNCSHLQHGHQEPPAHSCHHNNGHQNQNHNHHLHLHQHQHQHQHHQHSSNLQEPACANETEPQAPPRRNPPQQQKPTLTSQPRQQSTCQCQSNHSYKGNSHTLPRNLTFADHHNHSAPDTTRAPACCQQQQQPPSYGYGGADTGGGGGHSVLQAAIGRVAPQTHSSPSKGLSSAAAAAAATFVNLHRRNKGLPPSTNPAFAPFTPPLVTGRYNHHLETIFGIRPSDIDKYSRVVFPVCFVCFQLMYWIVYLHISAFLEPDQHQQLQPPPLNPQQQATGTT